MFLDESGFLLVPNLVRTWAPKGKTPQLRCAGSWGKISAISAISVSPKRRRLALYARFYRGKNIKSPQVARFLRHLLKHLRGPILLLWDSGMPHRGKLVKDFVGKHPRLQTFRFPSYAPELNPDEHVWRNLKRAVANSVPEDLRHLKRLMHPPLQRLRQLQNLLWSCIHASELPWG
ncbi:MAG: transposase [Elusimicrobia bacterium]|nr:transposase [Elusimicrobiota bacterium]